MGSGLIDQSAFSFEHLTALLFAGIIKKMKGGKDMDLSVSDMMQLQRDLFELHKDTWVPREPEYGKEHILYMMEEVGETIAILKKRGSEDVLADPDVRSAFLEEMSDILMYYIDILLCFHVTPKEISDAYLKKHNRNIHRNYSEEYKELYHNG